MALHVIGVIQPAVCFSPSPYSLITANKFPSFMYKYLYMILMFHFRENIEFVLYNCTLGQGPEY